MRSPLGWWISCVAAAVGGVAAFWLFQWHGPLVGLAWPLEALWPDPRAAGQGGWIFATLALLSFVAVLARLGARAGVEGPMLLASIVVFGGATPQLGMLGIDLYNWTITADRYLSPYKPFEFLSPWLMPAAHVIAIAVATVVALFVAREDLAPAPRVGAAVALTLTLVCVLFGALRWRHPSYLDSLSEVSIDVPHEPSSTTRVGDLCVHDRTNAPPDWATRLSLNGVGDEVVSRFAIPPRYAVVWVSPGSAPCAGAPATAKWTRWQDRLRSDVARGYVFRRDPVVKDGPWQELDGKRVEWRFMARSVRCPPGFLLLGLVGAIVLAFGAVARSPRTAVDPYASWSAVVLWAALAAPLALCAAFGFVL
ncbi:MAG: hypothetical protein U0235_00920 [Polyangiaceae bacterium]